MPITCSSNYNYLHLSLNTMKIYRELYIGRNWKGNWLCLVGKIVLWNDYIDAYLHVCTKTNSCISIPA